MIKHVIFDFDGTIVDSRFLAVHLLNEMAPRYGFRKIREAEFEHLRTLSIMERCRFVRLPLYKLPLIIVELAQRYRKATGSLQVYNGIPELIWSLKNKGIKLSIISSNSVENIKVLLKHNSIDVFDSIDSSGGLFGKDRAIRSFLRRHNLKSHEAVYIGDECRDIIACRQNKVRVIAVSWGFDSIELLAVAQPDYIVHRPSEIKELI